jgi:hypothetical protein
MDDRVAAAADNNARWCDIVCRSHGISTALMPGHWVARQRAPRFYPDAVTRSADAPPADVLELADDGPGCSVKDSFAALELAPLGFEVLFEAQWIFREPAPGTGAAASWSVVETEADLIEWTAAFGDAGTPRPELLHDPSVRILAARDHDGIGAGAIANRTGSVVGVSNVFTTSIAPDEAWSGLARTLADGWESLPLVGYEHGEDLDAALAAGFEAIGPLRIWLR